MGITDELRHEVADYPFRDNRDFAIFEAVADRICEIARGRIEDAGVRNAQGRLF